MEEFSELKSARLLSIYARLLNGRVLKKALLAQEFGVTARSIQRDLESLRSFLSNEMLPQDVVYDRAAGGYRLTHAKPMGLSNSEILAVCKILLESRSMRRDEMLPILDKLVAAPGNGAKIGGLKVVTENAWFAARPSGTEDVYKIYAESFLGEAHLRQIQQEAQQIVSSALDA